MEFRRTGFTLVLVLFLIYAGLFIYRSSFVVGGERYFSLFDDAMISMRYAKNLAEGRGAVWNPGGDRVEGYTNPLWTGYMALVHLMPLAPAKTSLVIQITAAALLAANLWFVYLLAETISNRSPRVALGAAALTASYLPLNFWSLQGMEVSVLTAVMTRCTLTAIRSLDSGTVPKSMYVILGIGTWIRPDMTVAFGAFLVFMLVADSSRWRQHLGWGVTVLAIAGTVQTAARLWYYGDVVPNTYYLKITGIPLAVRAARGVWVLGQFVWNANLLLFVLPFALLLRGDRRITLMLWIVVAQVAYSVYVGGDAWEYWGGSNRFICPVMPAFFVLLTYVLNLLAAALPAAIRGNRPFAASERYAVALFVFAVAAAMVSLNSIHGPAGLAEAALLRPPLHAGEGGENQMDVEQALALRDVTAPGATVAVVRAGTIPYFAGRTAIDLLGKNDRYVAHEPPRLSGGFLAFRDFRPGHVKFDFAYSIGRLEPDVILQLRQREEAATPFLQDYDDALLNGARIYVRRGSANVFRDRLHAGPD